MEIGLQLHVINKCTEQGHERGLKDVLLHLLKYEIVKYYEDGQWHALIGSSTWMCETFCFWKTE